MKMRFMAVIAVATTLMTMSVTAQVVSKDSINVLKQQKDALELGKKVNENKLKLAKLENSLESKMKDRQKAEDDAQKAADDNAKIASSLSNDSQDRKLAKKARQAAKSAEREAKKARKANSDLEDLQKDIDSLKKKIADDEAKLSAIPAASVPLAPEKN